MPTRLQPPPLRIGDETITNQTQQARRLGKEILERFTADDDLPTDPWATDVLPEQAIPFILDLEEPKFDSLIGAGDTTPGEDGIAMYLLRAAESGLGNQVMLMMCDKR